MASPLNLQGYSKLPEYIKSYKEEHLPFLLKQLKETGADALYVRVNANGIMTRLPNGKTKFLAGSKIPDHMAGVPLAEYEPRSYRLDKATLEHPNFQPDFGILVATEYKKQIHNANLGENDVPEEYRMARQAGGKRVRLIEVGTRSEFQNAQWERANFANPIPGMDKMGKAIKQPELVNRAQVGAPVGATPLS